MPPSIVKLDKTGVLKIDGKQVFPIGFSNPPPIGSKAPTDKPGLQELKDAGGTFVRTGIEGWSEPQSAAQIAEVKKMFAEAGKYGMHCWLWLGKTPSNLPKQPDGTPPSVNERLLKTIVDAFKGDGALLGYKGYDEPLHSGMAAPNLVLAHDKLKTFDPDHPLVLIQAPVHAVVDLKKYVKAFDVTGADIFPIANPPANHANSSNKDISVVGDVTRKMVRASGGKPVWMTLQIAWSHTPYPKNVPCFPTLHEERFMVYQAIVAGARGLTFFGGHMTQVCTPHDALSGWNWTFWRQVLKWIVQELSSDELEPALLAPSEPPAVKASTVGKAKTDIELVSRRKGGFLYVIAVKRGPGADEVAFSGLPRKRDGTAIKNGEVLFEHVQIPVGKNAPSHSQKFRPVKVTTGGFRDRFLKHDVHVYRFAI